MTETKDKVNEICAVVLAAGLSSRMGVPKMALPWRDTTVLGAVVEALATAGVHQVRVVLGANRDVVEKILDGLPVTVARVFNPNYANGEMMDSIRAGLAGLGDEVKAALIVLGDQPQLEPEVVSALIESCRKSGALLTVPSYRMRRGHPWLIGRPLWGELINMEVGDTMRDFLNRHAEEINYVNVNSTSVLQDLDTPEDYRKAVEQNKD